MQQAAQSKRYFWAFVIIHCSLWMILPTVIRYALPHDTIEAVMWGQSLEWGYDKNPWLVAWLARLGWEIGGVSGWGIYALSSFFVGLSFYAVWKLTEKMLPPLSALMAVLLLECCINYTVVPQGFNDNIIELGLWPLMFLCFYQAIHDQKIKDWSATGFVAGLAMMAKYYTAMPLLIMGLFLIVHQKWRVSFRFPALYIGLLIFLLVVIPHVIWLFQHDFLTVKYAFDRAETLEENVWKLHLYYPFHFVLTQVLDFLPAIILFILFKFKSGFIRIDVDNREFILWMALGPLLLTVFTALCLGWHLYSEWGVPLVTLWGALLFILFQPDISERKFKLFYKIIYIFMFLWAVGYIAGLLIDNKHKHSDNYPAQEIAHYVTDQWQARYHKPLKYVAGSRYIGGYVAFYAKDHPLVYVEWHDQFSPWINMADMKKYGAVFIQDNYYGTTVFEQHPRTHNGTQFPEAVLARFPNLVILPVKYFSWKRGNKPIAPIAVLVGFLPPEMGYPQGEGRPQGAPLRLATLLVCSNLLPHVNI